MCILVRETKIKHSRKDRECMASIWIRECGTNNISGLKFSEYRSIVKAKRQNWKILKGQPYIDQFIIPDGDTPYSFKAIPEIHAICLKYEFYPEC